MNKPVFATSTTQHLSTSSSGPTVSCKELINRNDDLVKANASNPTTEKSMGQALTCSHVLDHELLEGAELIRSLISNVEHHTFDTEKAERACRMIVELAGKDNYYKALIASSRGIEAIASLMTNHINRSRIQKEGCDAFGNMYWGNPSSVKKVIDNGGIDAIVSAVRIHPSSSELLSSACRALNSIHRSCTSLGDAVLAQLKTELVRVNAQVILERALRNFNPEQISRCAHNILSVLR